MYAAEIVRYASLEVVHLSGEPGEAEIIPALGAMVRQIALRPPGAPPQAQSAGGCVPILAADPDEPSLLANADFRGRQLFPFNDRIPGGRYSFAGRSYQLPQNRGTVALHGLVYSAPFELDDLRSTGTQAEARVHIEPERYVCPGYPFPLSLSIRFILSREGFRVEYLVKNRGRASAPFALGWHPYFRLGGLADAWSLRAESAEWVPVDDRLIPTGETAPVAETPFDFHGGRPLDHRSLDAAIAASSDGHYELTGGGYRLALAYDPALFRYLQLYLPPDRRSIAIEPVSAATNAFNLPGLGLRTIAPGATAGGFAAASIEPLLS